MPSWNLLNPQAPWQARDSQGFAVFNNRIWILGGWFTPETDNPRDVWSSPDGVDWHCHTMKAPWIHSDLPVTLAYDGRLWLMGGRKLPGKENSNAVWATEDGDHWEQVSPAADWCPRVSMAHTVFQDKMWVLGGTEDFYQDVDGNLHNDVWVSSDGIHWECLLEQAPWPARAHHQAVVFQDKLYVLGGGARFPEPLTRNDIWRTDNGVDWEEVTPAAPWGPRLWFNALVYRERLWIVAGWTPETDNYHDVWSSPDGVQWEQLPIENPWKGRHAQAGYVHHDQIIIAAGHARPVTSEVYALHLPPSQKSFASSSA